MKRIVADLVAGIAAVGLLLTLSPSAGAVSVSTTGLGQVLIFPYYTVRSTASGGAYNTLFTVTNTTQDTKVVRVRFRESRNGREVLSVNVFLGAFDSWVGALSAVSGGAVLTTSDQSCTEPPASTATLQLAFSNAQYSGANADGEDSSLARTLEGYVEAFELGVVKDPTVIAATRPRSKCNALANVQLDNSKLGPPAGGLAGNANIISVVDGTLYPYDATALSGFTAVPLYSAPTMPSPTLADVNPKISMVFDDAGAHVATWDVSKGAHPADPVSAVLMADQLVNVFVLDAVTASASDWVVTMPTKPFYVAVGAATSGSARPPFESSFALGGAPDYMGENYECNAGEDRTLDFDREGRNTAGACAPLQPNGPRLQLTWTASTVAFNANPASGRGGLLGAYLPTHYSTVFASGWLKLKPHQYATGRIHQLVSTDFPPVVFSGLPMIGFMANDYVNRTLQVGNQTVLSNYGATAPHRFVRRVQ